jgi:hypothetical protein
MTTGHWKAELFKPSERTRAHERALARAALRVACDDGLSLARRVLGGVASVGLYFGAAAFGALLFSGVSLSPIGLLVLVVLFACARCGK